MNTAMLLSISNATLTWTIIVAFLVGAFVFKMIDSIITSKKLERAYKAKHAIKEAHGKNNETYCNKAA